MIASLVCGLIFGAGLLISGMVQPTKVLGFLDIFGAWDPSLAVVMAAALIVAVIASRRQQEGAAAAMPVVATAAAAALAWQSFMMALGAVPPEHSARDLVTAVKPHVHPETALYSVGQYRETISPYLERTLTVVEFEGELEFGLHAQPGKQMATPAEIYNRPADLFVANFTGATNELTGTLVERNGDLFNMPELLRLKGQFLASVADAPQAEECFLRSLELARQQLARSWELRTTTSLARLWLRQDRRDEAREALSQVYAGFSEGFSTADLEAAKQLLNDTGEPAASR